MARYSWLICLLFAASGVFAQSFELVGLQESYKGVIGETIRVPVKFKNNTDKQITLLIRKIANQLGTGQKNYFCIDNNCLDSRTEEYLVKVDPNQTITSLQIAVEAGLAQGVSSVKYLASNKFNASENFEFDLNFVVEERAEKANIYSSEHLMLHDVYPNPVTDHAFVDYSILNSLVKAKIVIHNILGNAMEEYQLPASENKVKIRAESLNAGIYFYTLYVDNEGVVTRKLIVKK
jgi:hypothetical protein